MVKITEEQVYNALPYDWLPGREVQKTLRDQLGLNNLTSGRKLAYFLTFQSWSVNPVDFYFKVEGLKEQGLAETDDRFEDFEGEVLRIRYVKKIPGGIKKRNPEKLISGELELGLLGNV